jgi:hypothetical protein
MTTSRSTVFHHWLSSDESFDSIGPNCFTSVEAHVKAQDDIAEYIFGMVARRDGESMDRTKSPEWRRGWGEAQE